MSSKDVSEDVIPSATQNEDADPEEEIQDFRFLLSQKLPSRGIKDFEPHGTNLQQNTLDASREAMHTALSQGRLHGKEGVRAVYDPVDNGAWVFNEKGAWVKSVGKVREVPGRAVTVKDAQGNETEDKLRRMWLLPEEALWLIERGNLDIRFPAEDGVAEDEGLPMSLQGAYACFLGREGVDGLTIEEYNVYQYLKRSGYHVVRARQNVKNCPDFSTPPSQTASTPATSPWNWLFAASVRSNPERARQGPLIKPGLYRDYSSLYRQLSLIPFHDPRLPSSPPSTPPSDTETTSSLLRITWHVYQTTPGLKKTAPGPPDFYISVLSARSTSLPTPQELDALLQQTPYRGPKPETQLYKRLKDGHRNVLLSVVDQGVSSFLNISEAGFGCEKLYESPVGRNSGGWKGGRGGGAGRGGRGAKA